MAVSGVARPQGEGGGTACGRLLPSWTPHALRLCCDTAFFSGPLFFTLERARVWMMVLSLLAILLCIPNYWSTLQMMQAPEGAQTNATLMEVRVQEYTAWSSNGAR
jgi:uncharacterized protein YqjF (DUF2071 family)